MNTSFHTTEAAPGAADNAAEWALLDPLTMRARENNRVSLLGRVYRGLTALVRLLPDFLIIGTQRGGTTALYHYLRSHPCIVPAPTPDVHFFDKKYRKGLAWYRGHFPMRIEQQYAQRLRGMPLVTGEACSSYLFYPHTPKRVAGILPRVKIIVLLRNPVDRAYSQYYHALELGQEMLSFEEAIRCEEERIAKEREKILQDEFYYSNAYMHLSYLSRGVYVDQLQPWMKLFPREQFLILKSEDFYTEPVVTYKRVLAFLNVPEIEPKVRRKDYKHYSHNTYFSQMDPALRKRLTEYFEPHNARLYDFLGVDFGWEQ